MLEELIANGIIYALIGATGGLLAGILGIGGGMLVVPGLVYVFNNNPHFPHDVVMHMAAGSSLAVMIITAQAAVRAHLSMGEILWPVFKHMWPGIVIGTLLGSISARFLPTHLLQLIFGVFLLLIVIKMITDFHVKHGHGFPRNWVNFLINNVIGFKSGLLGIGGGALIIPYLTYCGVRMNKIPPVSSLCTLTVSVIGTLSFIILGMDHANLPPWSSGYVYWPAVIWVAIPSYYFAPLGARLTYKIPVKKLKLAFVIFLFMIAINMLTS